MARGYDAADDPPGWRPDPEQLAVAEEVAALLPSYHINVGLVWRLLLAYPEDHPVRQPVVQLSKLTLEKVDHIAHIKTGIDLYRLWEHRMQDYYFFQFFGALLLQSPLGERLAELATQEMPAAQREENMATFYQAHVAISKFLLDGLPQLAAMLCHVDLDANGQPVPGTDPDRAARYQKVTEQREGFREYFAEQAVALFEPVTIKQLGSAATAASARPTSATYRPDTRGPALTLLFSQAERSTMLLALALPTYAALLDHPFAKAFTGLSALQPARRVAALAQRLHETLPNRQFRLVLEEVLTFYQALQGLSLLLRSAAFPQILQQLHDKLYEKGSDVGDAATDDYRTLADEEAGPLLRKTATRLADSFADNLHKYYRKDARVAPARAETAALPDLL